MMDSHKKTLQGALLKCKKAAKMLVVQPALFVYVTGKLLLLSLSQQYFFFTLAIQHLKNSSFPLPEGPFCLDSSTLNNYSQDIYKQVMSQSNSLVAYNQIIVTLTSVLVTILSVRFQELYGYRVLMAFPAIGATLTGIIYFLVVYFHLNQLWFLLGSAIQGVFGDLLLIMSASFAYIAHSSSQRWLTLGLAIGEGVVSIGDGTGQLLSGLGFHAMNCRYIPLIVLYMGGNASVIAYIFVLVPEALSARQRKNFERENKRRNLRRHCGRIVEIFSKSFSRTWRLLINIGYLFLANFTLTGGLFISLYFLKAVPFNFNALQIGIAQSLESYSRALSSTVVMAVLVFLKVPDPGLILVGTVVSGVCSLLLGFPKKTWQVYIIFGIRGMDLIGWPGAESFMSKLLDSKEQSALFAVIMSIQGLGALASSFILPYVLSATVVYELPLAVPYFIMAGLAAVTVPFILLLLVFGNGEKNHSEGSIKDESEDDDEYSSCLDISENSGESEISDF